MEKAAEMLPEMGRRREWCGGGGGGGGGSCGGNWREGMVVVVMKILEDWLIEMGIKNDDDKKGVASREFDLVAH